MGTAERLRGSAVRGLLVLPALVFWPGARDGFLAPPQAVAGALAAVAFCAWLAAGAPGWRSVPPGARWLAAGWLGWLAIRIRGSVDPSMGLVTLGEWLTVALAACASLGSADRDRRQSADALAVAAALVGAVALVEFAAGGFPLLTGAVPTTSMPGRPGATLGNPVFLGSWLAAVLPLLAAAGGPGRAAVAMLAAGTIVLTGSRGALVAAAAGLGWLGWRGGLGRAAAGRVGAAAVAAGIVLASVRPATLAHLTTPRVAGRLAVWRTTAGLIRVHPLAGVGTGGFGAAYPCAQRRALDAAGGSAWSPTLFAHDEYLHALTETGPAGLALLVWWVVVILRVRPRDAHGAGAQAGVAALAVSALLAFPLHLPPTQLLWWMLPAMWLPGERPAAPPRRWTLAGGVLLAALAAWWPARLLVRNADLQAGIAAKHAGAFAVADARCGAALRLLPDTSRDRIGMQRAIGTFAAGELGRAEALLDADETRFPCTAEAAWYRAFVAVMRVASGQRHAADMAEERIAFGLSLGPPTARAAGFWTLRGHLRLALGDGDGARAAYRSALSLDPAQPDARSNLDRLERTAPRRR